SHWESPMTLADVDRPPQAPAGAPTHPPESGAHRPRRLRTSSALRMLVRETRLVPEQLVAPLFVVPGSGIREAIPALSGQYRPSADVAVDVAGNLAQRGIGGVLLFGVPDEKDPYGEGAADPGGPVPAALHALRAAGLPLVTIADVCLCEYTTHGHCGVISGERIDNDRS